MNASTGRAKETTSRARAAGVPAGDAIEPPVAVDLAGFYRVFGDATRLRILGVLMSGERCVHQLSAALGMQQSTISHQLRILRDARLVRVRRVGKEARYSLGDDHISSIFEQGMAHVKERSGEGR